MFHTISLDRSDRNRKPDLVLIKKNRIVNGWQSIMGIGEVKSNLADFNSKLPYQMADCLYNMFIHQPNRYYAISIAFIELQVALFIYDRSGIVFTELINFENNLELFLRLTLGVLFVDLETLGIDSTFSYALDSSKSFLSIRNYSHGQDLRERFSIEKIIFQDSNIRGRGTTIYKVYGTLAGEEKFYIVKDTFVDVGRIPYEHQILERLIGFPNVAQIVHIRNKETREIDFIGHEIFQRHSTDLIRGYIMHNRFESREHHRTVMSTYGVPIELFDSLEELLRAMCDVFVGK